MKRKLDRESEQSSSRDGSAKRKAASRLHKPTEVRKLMQKWRAEFSSEHHPNYGEEDEQAMQPLPVLGTGIPSEIYNAFTRSGEFSKHCRYENGTVVFGDPFDNAHGGTISSEVTSSFIHNYLQHGFHNSRFFCARAGKCIIDGVVHELDAGYGHIRRPRMEGTGIRFPAVVLEVGWRERIQELDQVAQTWLGPQTDVLAELTVAFISLVKAQMVSLQLLPLSTSARRDRCAMTVEFRHMPDYDVIKAKR